MLIFLVKFYLVYLTRKKKLELLLMKQMTSLRESKLTQLLNSLTRYLFHPHRPLHTIFLPLCSPNKPRRFLCHRHPPRKTPTAAAAHPPLSAPSPSILQLAKPFVFAATKFRVTVLRSTSALLHQILQITAAFCHTQSNRLGHFTNVACCGCKFLQKTVLSFRQKVKMIPCCRLRTLL